MHSTTELLPHVILQQSICDVVSVVVHDNLRKERRTFVFLAKYVRCSNRDVLPARARGLWPLGRGGENRA